VSDALASLGRMLVDRGVVGEEALAPALAIGPASESRFLSRLLQNGVAAEGDLVYALAERAGQPGVDLSTSAFLSDVLDLIPRPVAEGDQILALSTEGGRLHVAVTSPDDAQLTIDEVRFITGMEVSLYVALAGPLERTITAAYDAREQGGTVWIGSALREGAPLGLTIVQPGASLATPPSGSPTVPLAPAPLAFDDRTPPPVPPREPVLELAQGDGPPLELQEGDELPEGELLEGELLEEPHPLQGALEDGELDLALDALAAPPSGAPLPAPAARKPSEEIAIEIGDSSDDDEEEIELGSVRAGPKRILVVDDEPDIVKLCQRAFVAKGWIVDTAADGAEAEKKLDTRDPPDLVLLDAMLPQVHGFEICQRIKANKKLRGVQVVMMSAVYRGWRFAQDARETYGADDYIEKPFHLAELLRRVEERLQQGDEKKKTQPGKRDAEAAYKSGMEAFDKGLLPEARALLEKAVREDPFSPRSHFALARTLSAQGDVYRAISAYERAVELRPSLFPALKNLAALYVEKGFRRKAVETLERALQSAPDPATRETIRAQLLRLL
jgi:DNA-binding response OmpR family regulator